MRVLKWLFHPVNLLIIIVVVALYINRQTLFPEMSESPEVRQITDKVDAVIGKLDEELSLVANEVATGSDGESADTDEGVAKESVTTPETEKPLPEMFPLDEGTGVSDIDSSSNNNEVVVSDVPKGVPLVEEEDSVDEVTEAISAHAEGKSIVDGAADAVPSEEESVKREPGSSKDDPLQLWQEARRAAWEGDVVEAARNYRDLIAIQPKNYDAYGELGNVLLQQGDVDGAVDAYSQAAMFISQSHYPQVAWRVVEIVSKLDQKRAQQLYQQIREQQLGAASQR